MCIVYCVYPQRGRIKKKNLPDIDPKSERCTNSYLFVCGEYRGTLGEASGEVEPRLRLDSRGLVLQCRQDILLPPRYSFSQRSGRKVLDVNCHHTWKNACTNGNAAAKIGNVAFRLQAFFQD